LIKLIGIGPLRSFYSAANSLLGTAPLPPFFDLRPNDRRPFLAPRNPLRAQF
jgi:hypothetical protein